MPTKSNAKKAKPAKAAKAKTAPKKSNPKKLSTPMKKALDAVANMPVRNKDTKLEAVIQLLSRPEGATIEDMVAATGWQKHTIRSALSHALAKKRGYEIVSDKPKDGLRIYKIASAPKDKE